MKKFILSAAFVCGFALASFGQQFVQETVITPTEKTSTLYYAGGSIKYDFISQVVTIKVRQVDGEILQTEVSGKIIRGGNGISLVDESGQVVAYTSRRQSFVSIQGGELVFTLPKK